MMFAARRSLSRAVVTTQKRNFGLGGHHGPPPEWEGIDKVVRGYFPHDYQLAAAILGGYFGLYTLYSIKSAISGGKKQTKEEVAAPAPAVSSTPSTGIPDADSPEFGDFLGSEAFAKLLDNEEELKKLAG